MTGGKNALDNKALYVSKGGLFCFAFCCSFLFQNVYEVVFLILESSCDKKQQM